MFCNLCVDYCNKSNFRTHSALLHTYKMVGMSFPSNCNYDPNQSLESNVWRLFFCATTLIGLGLIFGCLGSTNPLVLRYFGYEYVRNKRNPRKKPGDEKDLQGVFSVEQDSPVKRLSLCIRSKF